MELEEVIENVKEAKSILLCNNVIELIVVITEGRKQGLFKNKFWDLENDEELDLSKLKNIAIEPILKELDKQEKMIDIIIKHICDIIDNDDNASLLPFYNSDDNIEEKVKQYFEKKAEQD